MTDASKISRILEEKYDLISNSLWDNWAASVYDATSIAKIIRNKLDELWLELMHRINCIIITHEEIREHLEGIINCSSKGKVCVSTRFTDNYPYILMHEELAKKILVLGEVPDSWSPTDE